MPATRARPRFVRSIREIAYIKPRIGKRRMSILRLSHHCQLFLSFNFGTCLYGWRGGRERREGSHNFLLLRFINTVHDLVLPSVDIMFLNVQDTLFLW